MKAFLAGLGIGAAVGLLIAPKAGAETRRDLADAANQRFGGLKDDLNQHLGEFKDSASESIDNLKEGVGQRISSVRETVSNVGDKISDAKDRVTSNIGRRSSLLEIINEWPEERLIEIHGIGPVLASKIIENRPYKLDSDLLEAKILPPSAIEALRNAA